MFDVFISHSSDDKKEFVEPLVDELIKLGLCVWYDKNNINKGDKIRDSIINAISESVIFIAIISKNYYQSNWVNLELGIIESSYPDNFLPVIFSDSKDFTGQKYSFLLEHNYLEFNMSIRDMANELKKIVLEKKQERGIWYIEKTNFKNLTKEMRTYNNFKLDQIAIKLNRIAKEIYNDSLSALNEIKLILELIFNDVAIIENIVLSTESSVLEIFLKIDFLNQNLREHIKFLLKIYNERVQKFYRYSKIEQENLYLIQFSVYSIIEWYMITYFKKPILKQKKLIAVSPEEFTETDIAEAYKIENLVLPPDLIASLSTDLKWFVHNPLTMVGAKDIETGKLVGFFNTLPISDDLFNQIKTGNFDDTKLDINDIRQYDLPGFYKLYLCSFCIHPSYNTTTAFKIIYTSFIDFLFALAHEREIYISDIIADGVTPKGASLCESIGMNKVTTSIHNSNVYIASLIPPEFISLKLNNKVGHKLITHYQKMYAEYRELF